MKVMAKCSLGALLAMALVCNANAKAEKLKDKNNSGIVDAKPEKLKDKNNSGIVDAKPEKLKGKNNGGIVDAEPRKDKDGIVYSVPDDGSSLALLAISVALVAVATRVAKLSNC
jgi:hypothetical protein